MTELKDACRLFLVPHASTLKNKYRDFKDSWGEEIGSSLKQLLTN